MRINHVSSTTVICSHARLFRDLNGNFVINADLIMRFYKIDDTHGRRSLHHFSNQMRHKNMYIVRRRLYQFSNQMRYKYMYIVRRSLHQFSNQMRYKYMYIVRRSLHQFSNQMRYKYII